MVKCGNNCKPVCDFCKYAIFDKRFSDDGDWVETIPIGCQYHTEDNEVGSMHTCDDFYCMNVHIHEYLAMLEENDNGDANKDN
jgi:hypothetical protein